MSVLGIVIGTNSRTLATKNDKQRITAAEKKLSEFAKKVRIEKIGLQVQQQHLFEEEEGIMYGPGIAD